MSKSKPTFTQLSAFLWPACLGALIAVAVLQFFYSQQLDHALSLTNQQHATLPAERSGYANAVKRALPSVVKIYTSKLTMLEHPLQKDPLLRHFFNRNRQTRDTVERGLGSGVVVGSDGYVLTNNHVIDSVDQIRVMLVDGRETIAKVVGTDAATDLAVLKIDLPDMTPAMFANHGTAPRIGDIVLAIGNPYGIGQTVTQGIVSATGRHGLNLNTYENYIQTDAAINQGNSGGALVNTQGEVIGINSALYSRSGGSTGIGFAIPTQTALHVFNHIINYGMVVRGWLGISVENVTPALAASLGLNALEGIIVTRVTASGPAQLAGIRPGDILTHINNQKIVSGNLSMHQIAQTLPGTTLPIGFIRNGAAQSTLVTLGQRPPANQSR